MDDVQRQVRRVPPAFFEKSFKNLNACKMTDNSESDGVQWEHERAELSRLVNNGSLRFCLFLSGVAVFQHIFIVAMS